MSAKSQYVVPHDQARTRLDIWLSRAVPGLSRARWQRLIRDGCVLVDDVASKPGTLLRGSENIAVDLPSAEPVELIGEDIPLDVLFEDRDLIVINKPPGLVVHPAPGHATRTLVHALLHHCGDLTGVGGELRPGIVHRLDKDTSGVMVAAKNQGAMQSLAAQFKGRYIRKEYQAIVCGRPMPPCGTIDTLMGRHPTNRKKMAVDSLRGKQAVSHYRVETVLASAALVRLRIETGRTHQIRVHMSHIGHPVCGDAMYGGMKLAPDPAPRRQMLHAAELALDHPTRLERLCFSAPLPPDMCEYLGALTP